MSGEDLPDERQQEPLALISFITMTTIVEFLHSGAIKLNINDQNIRQLLYASDLLAMSGEWRTGPLSLVEIHRGCALIGFAIIMIPALLCHKDPKAPYMA